MALAVAKAADQKKDRHKAVLAALIAWFGSKEAINATELPADLVSMLVAAGFSRDAVEFIGRKATVERLSGRNRGGTPPATGGLASQVAAEEPKMRAEYLMSAAERLTEDNSEKAKNAEERFLEQHVSAGQNRLRKAKEAAKVFKQTPVVQWVCVMDERTDGRCAVLNGRLFTMDSLPGIPGAMHPRCRCSIVPHGNGPLVDWGMA